MSGILLGCFLSACSGYPGEPTGTEGWAVVGGVNSTIAENHVLYLSSSEPEHHSCSATLIAPNAVLTALHCVSSETPGFVCAFNGETDERGYLGAALPVESLELRAGLRIADSPILARGKQLFSTGSNHICRGDLAVLILDRDVNEAPAPVRLQGPIERGEMVRVVGYSQYGRLEDVDRHSRRLPVKAVGISAHHEAQGLAAPNTFLLGQGPCNGDSGGPAFSEETGAIVGVYSLLAGETCEAAGVANVFTAVHPFKKLLENALDQAGHVPLKEQRPLVQNETGEPSVGSGARRESASCLLAGHFALEPVAPPLGSVALGAIWLLLLGWRSQFMQR